MKFTRPTLTLATALLLFGCADTGKSVSVCPASFAIADAHSITEFRNGAARDPSGELYHVAITGTSTDCNMDRDQRSVTSSLVLNFHATRPAPGDAAQFSAPYFVAVTDSDNKIIVKREFTVQFAFAAGATTSDFTDNVDSTTIKLAENKQPTDYSLVVGMQLTKEQLDYNRTVGRFAP